MQTTADRAVAVEDSLTDFRSACATGLTCIVCPDHFISRPENVFTEADLVVSSLLELNATHLQRAHAARDKLTSINSGK